MSLYNTLHFIITHPLNKNRKIEAIKNWMKWQLGSRLVPGPVVVDFVNNAKLLCRPGMTGATGNIYTGLHEFEDMSFVLHMLRQGDLFVDVGANIGSYTILASAVIGAKTIAFEPIPETYQNLLQNVAVNRITGLVDAYNIGIGKEEGILNFSSHQDTVNHVLDKSETDSGKAIAVKISTLDEMLGRTEPNLIKIDVEGFESQVIAGAGRVMKKDSLDAIIMELNGSGTRYGFDDKEIHETMTQYGFFPFRYLPFDRTLLALKTEFNTSGNTLYIKNISRVTERLCTALPFYVHGGSV